MKSSDTKERGTVVRKTGEQLLKEEFFITVSMFKWIILAIITGIVVGSGASLFLWLLEHSIHTVRELPEWRYLLLFPGLWFSYYVVLSLTKNAKVDVEEDINLRSGAVNIRAIPVRLFATIVTIASGGSAGKEGPSAQIGAGLMYCVSKLLRLNDYDRKRLVGCGLSAGISAVFGTPITGAIFGIEVLCEGRLEYDILMPSFIGGIVSGITTKFWHAGHLPSFPVTVPPLEPGMLFIAIAAGVFFGLVSLFHIECLAGVKKLFASLKVKAWQKPFIGALIMLGFALLWGDTYLGLGDETIIAALSGHSIPMLAFALKSFAMAVTLSCGGNGGVLTPTLFIGAVSGSFLANSFGLDREVMSALGFVAVLAGSTNTPIASTVLAMEVFGAAIAPFAGIACCVSYLITGHRSLYHGQLIKKPKIRNFVRKKMPDGTEKVVCRFDGVPVTRLISFKLRGAKKRLNIK